MQFPPPNQPTPPRVKAKPAPSADEIYDVSESCGWWDIAEFLAKRPEVAGEFIEEFG
jgi:hypothetical protein